MQKTLITGAAGFIGFHVIQKLTDSGQQIIGIDNLNDYYDVSLKKARLNALAQHKNFTFEQLDIADNNALQILFKTHNITRIIHLAAQAGVRYSLENPQAYIQSNINGFANLLEAARHSNCQHMLYASSSSIYGANEKMPYSELHITDTPISLYAATKKSNELLAFSYASMYQIPLTGLRFFTVYGPWGRPDMAYFKFTKSIFEGQPIIVYNNGNMHRDFTYIDDIVDGILATFKKPPTPQQYGKTTAPHVIYNIGNNDPEQLSTFIDILEQHIGKKAIRDYQPVQTGDVFKTYANIDKLHAATGFKPQTSLDNGLKKFVKWYRSFYL